MHFLKLGFLPYINIQQSEGKELQEKEEDNDEKHKGKLITKTSNIKRAQQGYFKGKQLLTLLA